MATQSLQATCSTSRKLWLGAKIRVAGSLLVGQGGQPRIHGAQSVLIEGWIWLRLMACEQNRAAAGPTAFSKPSVPYVKAS